MKMMSFHIPEDLKARLDAYAEMKGVAIATIVRLALLHYLNRYAKSTRLAGGEK
jgi:predicted DNA-binding protein